MDGWSPTVGRRGVGGRRSRLRGRDVGRRRCDARADHLGGMRRRPRAGGRLRHAGAGGATARAGLADLGGAGAGLPRRGRRPVRALRWAGRPGRLVGELARVRGQHQPDAARGDGLAGRGDGGERDGGGGRAGDRARSRVATPLGRQGGGRAARGIPRPDGDLGRHSRGGPVRTADPRRWCAGAVRGPAHYIRVNRPTP